MSDREKKRTAAALFMMMIAAVIVAISGLRSVPDAKQTYITPGRNYGIPVILLPDGTINVNNADADELTGLYGVGETLASMIADERRTNGMFYYPEDLTSVKGIGIRKLEGFRKMISLE